MIPSGPAQTVIVGVYARLVAVGPNGDVVPYVAKSWNSVDSSTLAFDLRSDVTCADGKALTPTDVANSFTRLFKSPSAAPFFGQAVPTITSDNAASTVQFKWAKPNPDALLGFAYPYASVICPAGLADPTKLRERPEGTGPYTLSDSVRGGSATLTKNPAFRWGPFGSTAKDLPDSLTLDVVTNDTTAANQLLTRELDAAVIQGPDVERLTAEKSLLYARATSFKLSQLWVNATPGHPGADPQVRRAIMTALDPAAWNQAAYSGRGVTGTSIFSKDATCYEPTTAQLMPTPSIAAARQILSAAGYVAGTDGRLAKAGKVLSVNLVGSPTEFGRGTEYIATQLDALGIKVSVLDTERSTYIAKMRGGDWDVTQYGNGSPNIPSFQAQFIAGPLPPKGTNFSYYVDPALDAALDAALNAGPDTRCKAWSELQLQALRNYDMLPLAATPSHVFTQAKLFVVFVVGFGLDIATLRRAS